MAGARRSTSVTLFAAGAFCAIMLISQWSTYNYYVGVYEELNDFFGGKYFPQGSLKNTSIWSYGMGQLVSSDPQLDNLVECIMTLKQRTSPVYGIIYAMVTSRFESTLPACQEWNITTNDSIRHDEAVVPNIAHYIWFGENLEFRFDHLISLLSAHRIMKAEKILFHTNNEPYGEYWEEAKRTIEVLEVIYRDPPKSVFQLSLGSSFNQHSSDVARLEILLEYGGIYMDLDVIVVSSLEPLRHYDFVMGREAPGTLNNCVLIAKKDSLFLKLFYAGYISIARFCWRCDSFLYPNALAVQYPGLIHIDQRVWVTTTMREAIFHGHLDWSSDYATIHTFMRDNTRYESLDFNPENIKTLNSTFGEMARHVYYGNDVMVYD
ncbi:uncharacterized protein LOC144359489 [Saccoglossus kowalevskii]